VASPDVWSPSDLPTGGTDSYPGTESHVYNGGFIGGCPGTIIGVDGGSVGLRTDQYAASSGTWGWSNPPMADVAQFVPYDHLSLIHQSEETHIGYSDLEETAPLTIDTAIHTALPLDPSYFVDETVITFIDNATPSPFSDSSNLL